MLELAVVVLQLACVVLVGAGGVVVIWHSWRERESAPETPAEIGRPSNVVPFPARPAKTPDPDFKRAA